MLALNALFVSVSANNLMNDDKDVRQLAAENDAPLFDQEEGRGLRTRWEAIQAGFVDEPKAAVEQADALVAELMRRLTDVFAAERDALEKQLGQSEKVSLPKISASR